MTKPILPNLGNLLADLATAKPSEGDAKGNQGATKVDPRGPAGTKASTRPPKTTLTHTRSTNRGK